MLHSIRRQTMHLKVRGSQQLALGLQQRLSRLCHEQLSPLINEILDAHAVSGQYLFIEQLKLDLGAMSPDQLEHQLAQRLPTALKQALSAQLHAVSTNIASSDEHTRSIYSAWQYQIAAFVYFLEYGYLPWWYTLPSGQTLEQAILAQLTQTEATQIQQQARQLVLPVLRHSQARERLSRQFSAVFQSQCLLWLKVQEAQPSSSVLLNLTRQLSDALTPGLLSDLFWQPLWNDLSQGRSITLQAHWERLWKQLPVVLQADQAMLAIQQQYFSAPDTAPAFSKAAADPRSHNIQAFATTFTSDDAAVKVFERQDSDAAAEIYIANAGLVLLHPFLPQLFSSLGIADETRILAPERALALLHYLASAQDLAQEYQLALAKVLLNLPLRDALATLPRLSHSDQDAANELLQAVIQHWPVLRNTSADGLRGSFLLRPGKLSLRPGGDWLLQVERQAVDILLDQLPWSISLIKLPWMSACLWVEWY